MCNKMEREQVKEILKMPINTERIRRRNEDIIEKKDKKIYSTQMYYSSFDPDMSDFAVGFYNIVYKDILEPEGVLDGKYFRNKNFAGDTINSFNSIARLVSSANKLPNFLREYYNRYHCLANFWIIPMALGRNGKKLNYYDSADAFLNILNGNYDKLKKYTDYYNSINNYDKFGKIHFYNKFCEIHFIKGYKPLDYTLKYTLDDILKNILKKYSISGKDEKQRVKDAEDIVQQAYTFIDTRADNICENAELCKELYDYFKKWHLIKDCGTSKNNEES